MERWQWQWQPLRDLPERRGQPVCKYYEQTGTCMFGPRCRFHHPIPRYSPGITQTVQFNVLGYPLRPNARKCEFYLKNGWCHFSSTCRYDHPEPSESTYWWHSSMIADQQSNAEVHTSPVGNPYWQNPSNYGQMIIPPGLVQVPSWDTFPGRLDSPSSSGRQQQNFGKGQFIGTSGQSGTTIDSSASVPCFPMRPGEPDCPFLLKTGSCKFGVGCRFNHPKEKITISPYCMLSPMGLPLRPGKSKCGFYRRNGFCGYGSSCKFDHPIAAPQGVVTDGLLTPSSDPVVQPLLEPSSGLPALTLSSESSTVDGPSKGSPLSESQKRSSDDANKESE